MLRPRTSSSTRRTPNHLYIATLRGRGGIRRTTPPSSQPFGVYESTNGGAAWTLLKGTTSEIRGATDLVMDPADAQHPVGVVLG